MSIGIFSSSLTQNQIVAFILAVFLSFMLYSGFESLSQVNVWGSWSAALEQLGLVFHYQSMSKGLIDTRDVVYFLSVIVVMIFAANLVLKSRKW